MSSKGTSREHCVQGLEHGNAHTQRKIYDLLQERGPLCSEEIGDEFGLTKAGARSSLKKLRRDGHIQKRPCITNPLKTLYEVSDDE